jgi:hypothetical protein
MAVSKHFVLGNNFQFILWGSDNGVLHSDLLGIWTLSIQHSKKLENTKFKKLPFLSSGGGGRPVLLGSYS